MRMLGESVRVFNPGIFFDGSVLNLGLDFIEWGILLVSLAILITASAIQYRMEMCAEGKLETSKYAGFGNIREYLASKGIVLRWVILIGLLFYVILLAKYGPGYSAAEFIYKDF
jgi:threonine/homoserine efflux transporter RhtA